MMLAEFPPPLQERIFCSILAAVKYEVPVNIVLAVAEKEGGKPWQWVKNSNGTYDVGSMQFNTRYLEDLKPYGIKVEDVAEPGCYSFDLAAWRLRTHLKNDKADIWTRAANYHSRTPKYNQIYRTDLIKKAKKWGYWLERHFETYGVVDPGVAPLQVIQSPMPQQPLQKLIKTKDISAHQQANQALDAFFRLNPMRGFS